MEEQEAVPQEEWDVVPVQEQVVSLVLQHKSLVSVSVRLEHSKYSAKMVVGRLAVAKSIRYTLKETKAVVPLHSAVLLRVTR